MAAIPTLSPPPLELIERTNLCDLAPRLLNQPGRPRRGKFGPELVFFSPRRQESGASLHVHAQGFKDFGDSNADGKGGVLDFLRVFGGMDTREALDFLRDYHGYTVGAPIKPLKPARPFPALPPTEPHNLDQLLARVDAAHAALYTPAGAQALAWLHKRGLQDETIRRMKIGYQAQAVELPGELWLTVGIWFPFVDADGHLVQIKVRRPNAPKDKRYTSIRGSRPSAVLYNEAALYAADVRAVVLVEGEIDALTLQQLLGPAVAVVTTGSASGQLTRAHLDRLQALGLPVFVTGDSDDAGRNAQRDRLAELHSRAMIAAIMPAIPDGHKDANAAIMAGADLAAWWEARPTPAGPPLRIKPLALAAFKRVVKSDMITETLAALAGQQAQARLGEVFTVGEAAAALGWDVAPLRQALNRIAELFRVSAVVGGAEDEHTTTAETRNNSRRGRKERRYRLPAQAELDALIAPHLEALLVQDACPEIVPLDIDMARHMYADDADGDDLDLLAEYLAGAPVDDPQALERAQRALGAARRRLAAYDEPLPPIWSADWKEHKRKRTALLLERTRAQSVRRTDAARVLGCSLTTVRQRALAADYVPRPNWHTLEAIPASEGWKQARIHAHRHSAKIMELHAGERVIHYPEASDFEALPADLPVTIRLRAADRYEYAPEEAEQMRAPVLELVKSAGQPRLSTPAPALPTSEPLPPANRYGWLYSVRLREIKRRVPRIDGDGVIADLGTLASAVQAAIRAALFVSAASPAVYVATSGADSPAAAQAVSEETAQSCAMPEPPTFDELPVLFDPGEPPPEEDDGDPWIDVPLPAENILAAPPSPWAFPAGVAPLIEMAQRFGATVRKVSSAPAYHPPAEQPIERPYFDLIDLATPLAETIFTRSR